MMSVIFFAKRQEQPRPGRTDQDGHLMSDAKHAFMTSFAYIRVTHVALFVGAKSMSRNGMCRSRMRRCSRR